MIKNGLIVLLVLLAVFLFTVKRSVRTVTKTTVDTLVTTKTLLKHTKGENISIRVLDTVYQTKTDTAYIVKDYNQVKEYKDTIVQDSNRYVITDTISQNKIIGRSFQAKIQEKTIYITNQIEPKKRAAIYLGFRSDIRHDLSKVEHNATLHLKTKNKGVWTVFYGTESYGIGYAFKLKL